MQNTIPPTASLRPHHALCVLFFEGKGYSQAFIENMRAFLDEPDQMLQVAARTDILCQECPHNRCGTCDDESKVALFDEHTLHLTDPLLKTDQPIPLRSHCQSVYAAILQKGLLAEVCGECEWASLCQGKWELRDLNYHLLTADAQSSQLV